MSTLDNFRKDAKRWLKALRAGDRDARRRLGRAYPAAPAALTLRDVQHALAREQNAASWTALKARIASGVPRSESTPLTELLAAADAGRADRVAELAAAHPGIVGQRGTLPGHTGLRTALHFGVSHPEVVRALLERGADPNVRDEGDNAIPLHFAAERGDADVIHLLVEHGSDTIGADDGHELDVMGWLCVFGRGNRDLVDYLLAHGSRHNIMSAVAMGEPQIIEAIVRGDPSQLNRAMDRANLRRGPLHLAAVKKQLRSLDTLIALGADTPAPAPAEHVERYDRLARDLVVAFETGQADAMARLQPHYGGAFTWEELRANVRMRLDAIPDGEKPDGYFALPHARLLVARQAGFASWSALMES